MGRHAQPEFEADDLLVDSPDSTRGVRSLAEILADHRRHDGIPAAGAELTLTAAAPAVPTAAAASASTESPVTPEAIATGRRGRSNASELIAALTAELAVDHPGLLEPAVRGRRHAPPHAVNRRTAPRRAGTKTRRRVPVRTPIALAGALALTVVITDQAGLLSNAHDANATGAAKNAVQPVSASSVPSSLGTDRDDSAVSRSSRGGLGTDQAAPAGAGASAVVTPPPTPTSTFVPGQTIGGTWIRPSATGKYNSCFCSRWGVFHEGIDFAAPLGSPILAVGDGTVIDAGPAQGFGNWVVIQHDDGDVTIYGHMRYYYVKPGDHVTAGQEIALVGEEGQATGPHLHLGVRQGGPNGPYIDPVPWLVARGIDVGPYNPNA